MVPLFPGRVSDGGVAYLDLADWTGGGITTAEAARNRMSPWVLPGFDGSRIDALDGIPALAKENLPGSAGIEGLPALAWEILPGSAGVGPVAAHTQTSRDIETEI